MPLKKIDLTLRIGLAFAFLYPAIDHFFNPGLWNGFFPTWLVDMSPLTLAQMGIVFAVFEIIIALGILFMPNPRIPATLAFLILAGIVVFDWSAFDIVFRDISIALMALALIFLHRVLHKKNV